MPFERARTLLAKGRLHRRRKEKRLADETLREALAIFESLGAPDWARRTGAELGRVGRRPHAPDSLTETERRVAELAATGLSNREVAERAFIAPKTVGNVLGRVYEKLGIHSRAELGAVMASESASRRLIGAIAPYLGTRRANTVHRMDRPAVVDPQSPATFLVERYWPGIDLGRLRGHAAAARCGRADDDGRGDARRARRLDPDAGRRGRVLAHRRGRRGLVRDASTSAPGSRSTGSRPRSPS